MKVLDANHLHQGIQKIEIDLKSLNIQLKQIQKNVDAIISLEDSFTGKGAQSIRSFYQECHVPFLLFMEGFIRDYESTLKGILKSLKSLEPDEQGFIRQTFLQNDLEQGLNKAENVTIALTDEVNTTIASVQDIVSLSKLDDGEFRHNVKGSRDKINTTLEQLVAFDTNSTASLGAVESDMHLMQNYIQQISDMFSSGELSIGNYSVRQLSGHDIHQQLMTAVGKKATKNAFSLDVFFAMGAEYVLSRFGPLSQYLIHYVQEKFEMRTMDTVSGHCEGLLPQADIQSTGMNLRCCRGKLYKKWTLRTIKESGMEGISRFRMAGKSANIRIPMEM